jgi:hypothetical protein
VSSGRAQSRQLGGCAPVRSPPNGQNTVRRNVLCRSQRATGQRVARLRRAACRADGKQVCCRPGTAVKLPWPAVKSGFGRRKSGDLALYKARLSETGTARAPAGTTKKPPNSPGSVEERRRITTRRAARFSARRLTVLRTPWRRRRRSRRCGMAGTSARWRGRTKLPWRSRSWSRVGSSAPSGEC